LVELAGSSIIIAMAVEEINISQMKTFYFLKSFFGFVGFVVCMLFMKQTTI
jgi:hypothetical protein